MKFLRCILLLSVLGLFTASSGLAQTLLVNLSFDNSADRLEQTGSASTTFSTHTGTVTYGTGVGSGTAAIFNGSSSLQASGTPMTTGLTVAFWMKTTSTYNSGTQWYQGAGLVDGELGGDTTDWGVSLLGNKVAFGIGSSDLTLISTTSVNTGDWIFVAGTWDTSGAMNLYVNGVLEKTSSSASTVSRITTNPFLIGKDLSGAGYVGSLDQIRLYGSALTSGQVSSLQASSIPEPSTYAALAGLAALGVALWCRRKS